MRLSPTRASVVKLPALGVMVGSTAGSSVKVTLMMALSPMFKAVSSVAMLTVGATVSTVNIPTGLPTAPAKEAGRSIALTRVEPA